MGIGTILQIIGFVLFVLAAFGIALGRLNLTALGLACITLAMFIGQLIPAAPAG
jgi:hypothetical protein